MINNISNITWVAKKVMLPIKYAKLFNEYGPSEIGSCYYVIFIGIIFKGGTRR